MPLIFLIVGAGVFFGLKYSLSRNESSDEKHEPETTADESKEDEEPPSEETSEVAEPEEPIPQITVSPFAGYAKNANGTNSASTYDAVAHEIDGVKYVYYKTLVWGTVVADFEDFKAKVAETLSDSRGWVRAGLKFVEVTDGQDLNIVLSDPTSLDGYNGYCSSDLSCTSGYNEVIINDVRWREGTTETVAGGMSTRDYQNMVVNHEVGHWLGHYSHIEACDTNGGTAPIMLQQSTGLRNCGAFNPWPLDGELWILR